MKIVTAKQMKQVERYCLNYGLSFLRLMENAGAASFGFIKKNLEISQKHYVVICGKGNNGGDGFVVARKLYEEGAYVSIILTSGIPVSDEAIEMYDRARSIGVELYNIEISHTICLDKILKADVIIDAIYGTGFDGIFNDNIFSLCTKINDSKAKKLSLDVPSGVNTDSGMACNGAIKSDFTVTFGSLKYCHITSPGRDYCGQVHVADIGIPDECYLENNCNTNITDLDIVKKAIPIRYKESHKGSYGHLVCVCGNLNMTGAAYFSASGALKSGVGLVTVASSSSVVSALSSSLFEPVFLYLEQTKEGQISMSNINKLILKINTGSACLIGCGIGVSMDTKNIVYEIIRNSKVPLIIDADGINIISQNINILKECKVPIVLTPHPGEISRLTGTPINQIQANRIETSTNFVKLYPNVTLVLKGNNTIITSQNGQIFINTTGNSGLAKGGSGDILAGLIAGFVAQGVTTINASISGAYIHGVCADLAAIELTEYAMLPSDVLAYIPKAFKQIFN